MAGLAARLNQVRLSVTLSEKKAKRFTPGGLPVLELTVSYSGEVQEAGSGRQIQMTAKAKAVGQIAERIDEIPLGAELCALGFLAAARLNSKQLIFHITDFELE
ncbi:MAG: primosomal replication protein N [Betaproteobacteria bacterium]|jgi:primosomal replication protein N|nr:primosomal replication protein N [Betaproteobacteria bacterium]